MNRFGINGNRVFQEVETLFSDLLRTFPAVVTGIDQNASTYHFPAVNLWEQGETLYAEAELPGVNMADLEVSVQNNELTIRGQRQVKSVDGATYHRRERAVGSFVKVVTLPAEVDPSAVQANLKDGVLTVTLPKAAHARPRKITVNVG